MEAATLAISPTTALSTVECRFCDSTETISESDAGHVIPSWGAYVEGWLLICSRRHVYSLSELTTVEWAEFRNLRDATREAVERRYGPTVMFEHGAAGTSRLAGCGVNHAHAHIVPLEIDLREAVGLVATEVGAYSWASSTDQPVSTPNEDYIWLADSTGEWLTAGAEIPSQVVRRAIAASLGVAEWDWKANLRLDHVTTTTARMKKAGR